LAKLTQRFGNTPTALVGYNEGPRYAKNYKIDYINNSRYVHKVVEHLLTFEPIIAGI
jgi:soluble lytic murein transglycosylase-like protein